MKSSYAFRSRAKRMELDPPEPIRSQLLLRYAEVDPCCFHGKYWWVGHSRRDSTNSQIDYAFALIEEAVHSGIEVPRCGFHPELTSRRQASCLIATLLARLSPRR